MYANFLEIDLRPWIVYFWNTDFRQEARFFDRVKS